jgi:type VI secretion system secreted protein VgrG
VTTFHFTGEQPLAHVEWTVYQIEGREAVSELFHFAVVVGADLHAVEAAISGEEPLQPEARARDQTPDQRTIETAAIQQPVAFAFTREDTTERFGIVAAATVLGVVASRTTGATMVVVRFDVAPRAWVTHHRRRSRVFQNLRMHQIVSRVLAEMNVSHRWVLQKNYPKRVYAVQYDETDWAFVTRLLAEEGVFFFFEHGPFEREDEPPEGEETWRQVRRGARLAGQGLNALGSVPVIGPYARGGAAAANALAGEEDPVEEEEDPAQIAPGSGSGGPATEAGDVLVFVDQPESYLAKLRRGTAEPPDGPAPELRLDLRSADGMVSDLGALRLFVPRRTIRPLRTHVRDYEFKNPLFELSARASTLPRAEAPPSPDLEVYHHHGEYERPDVNDENAGLHLEQHRADAAVALGEGRHPDLGAGVRFRLENHSEPRVPVPEGRFAAARVWHRFAQPDIETAVGELLRFVAAFEGVEGLFPAATRDAAHEAMAPSEAWTYANRFECVRDTTAFRPPRPRRAPRTSIELATVVGPIGEEVYTDKHGRIKVQFHWDREGKWLPESSCWVRVAQTWGGAGFGSMFIPRVGMEVVVAFVGGDPDRPVVVGTLYNGTHPTAEPLPAKKTRSGFTTQISPGGGGGNELSFEDAREHAEVRLRAHKDLNVQVGDTHSTTVTGDAVKLVGGDDHVGVQGDRVVGVGGSRASLVSAVDALVVGGDRSTRVAGNALASVGGDAVAQVDGNAVRTTDHDALEHVAGDRTVRTDGNTITHVGGHALDGDAQAVTFVEGSWRLHATRTIEVHADAGGPPRRRATGAPLRQQLDRDVPRVDRDPLDRRTHQRAGDPRTPRRTFGHAAR